MAAITFDASSHSGCHRRSSYGTPSQPSIAQADTVEPASEASVSESAPAGSSTPFVMADPRRAAAIFSTRSKWANGTVLHYCFFGAGSHFSVPKVQADAIRDAFNRWKAIGIGLEFQEVNQLSEAEVRIG